MMKQHFTETRLDEGVSNLIEHVSITGILMFLLVVLILMVNTHIMEGPANQVSYAAFTDIGNGVSTRIVDVYVIAPQNGSITTQFDLPDTVAERDYFVRIGSVIGSASQIVEVSRGGVSSRVSLAGIGITRGVRGNTTGRGMNRISYRSEGV